MHLIVKIHQYAGCKPTETPKDKFIHSLGKKKKEKKKRVGLFKKAIVITKIQLRK